MAKVSYSPGIDLTTGALDSKHELITRQMTFRDARGRIIAYGKQEGYFIANPRNFKQHPMKGRELEPITCGATSATRRTLPNNPSDPRSKTTKNGCCGKHSHFLWGISYSVA